MLVLNKRLLILLLFLFSCNQNEKRDKKKIELKENKSLPFFNTPDFTPNWEKGSHKIPNFSFINQEGKKIDNFTYKDKIYIADFFFTSCPGICPKLTSNMFKLQETFIDDEEVLLLSHSVMPSVDNEHVLNEYAKLNSIDSKKWNLVTGDKEKIYEIARKGYFADDLYKRTLNIEQFIHTEKFILVDKHGYIRGVYNGTIELDINRLIRHINILKKEI